MLGKLGWLATLTVSNSLLWVEPGGGRGREEGEGVGDGFGESGSLLRAYFR